MSFIVFIVVGLVAGVLARALMPGSQSTGVFGTILLGMVGSFVGGMIGSLIRTDGNWIAFHPSGVIWSTVGALVVLGTTGWATARRI